MKTKLQEKQKEIKRMRAKLENKLKQHKLSLKDEIQINKTLTKKTMVKIKNQKNKDQWKQQYMTTFNSRTELKT